MTPPYRATGPRPFTRVSSLLAFLGGRRSTPARTVWVGWHLSRRAFLAGSVSAGMVAAGLGASVGSPAYAAAARARGLGTHGALRQPGSRPYPHLPAGTDTLPQIEHIVVIMMENHSFDDHLGTLGRGDGLTPGADGRPVNYNPDPSGGYVRSFHNPNTCGETDSGITQSWNASHTCWDNGTNMGFVKGCSGAAMGYWEGDDLPFYHSMARLFPIGDRYFSSVMAQTYPNRRFLIAGTALGNISTDVTGISKVDAPNGTIFDRLNEHGITWKDYYADLPTCALFEPVFLNNRTKAVHMTEFFADAASGSLPAFSLVDPYGNFSEEDGDITVGEGYAALFIKAVMSGPAWDKTALIWVYDEHGGWYDHVPPATGGQAGRRAAHADGRRHPRLVRLHGISCSLLRGVGLVEEGLRLASHLRPHVHPEVGRDEVEPAGIDLPRRERQRHVGLLRPDGEETPLRRPSRARGTQEPVLAARPPSRPAPSPPRSRRMFHTTCSDLPAGSLPPAERAAHLDPAARRRAHGGPAAADTTGDPGPGTA